jgi:hypothetical protein
MVFGILSIAQVREQIPQSALMHGTVDIVISTREGFVLATDSRGTMTRGTETIYDDNVQKLFPIGDHIACVIAGLIGSEIGSGALHPREAVGTSLVKLDEIAAKRSVTVTDVASFYQSGLRGVGSLVNLQRDAPQSQVGQLSVVSISPQGEFEWISFVLPLNPYSADAGYKLRPGTPVYSLHIYHSGLRFDVEILGQPRIADWLLQAQRPGVDSHSQSEIMRRYYDLKGAGELDRFTLDEAVILARELVQATIDLAPETAGVHGPIDIAILTRTGIHWINRKHATRFPSPHPSVIDSSFGSWHQVLDNLQCIHCDFTDTQMVFKGNADVQLLNSKFGGKCRLFIRCNARYKMPEEVSSLKDLVKGKCEVIEPD